MNAPQPSSHRPDRKDRFGDPRRANRLFYGLALVCATLFLADGLYHKHVNFAIENGFGFYTLLGFGACIVLAPLAKCWRWVVKRDEDYYGD
jgi:hypothetical protein